MKYTFLALLMVVSFQTFAQDTTWVQTFTFDSISTRRAEFQFPQELNDKRFERILMYYKLKCDPQTPWDGYECGEWDYLAYTRLFEHTGVFDSVKVDSVKYLNNWSSFNQLDYDVYDETKVDEYGVVENYKTGFTSNLIDLGMTASSASPDLFNTASKGSVYQVLLTESELSNAGVLAGEISSLSLDINQIVGSGELMHPIIRMKSTANATIDGFETTGFTEVYNRSFYNGAFSAELTSGENEFVFHTEFVWDGVSNVLVEFEYHSGVQASNVIEVNMEDAGLDKAINYTRKNGVLHFDGTSTALLELSDVDFGDEITIAFWAQGLGNIGQSNSIIEAKDADGNRVFNVHFPWSDNVVYWDAGEGSGYDRINKLLPTNEIDNEWHHWSFTKNAATGIMNIYKDGTLWHSGTNMNSTMGDVHRIILGSKKEFDGMWNGMIDEFAIFNKELDAATILEWKDKSLNDTHPEWTDLLVYYDFDDNEYAVDKSSNDYALMPSTYGMFDFSQKPLFGNISGLRPVVKLGQGVYGGVDMSEVVGLLHAKEPQVVFEFGTGDRIFEITNSYIIRPNGSEFVFDENGQELNAIPFTGAQSFQSVEISYYEEPRENINDIEIGRFITPYGINFDLGANGFTWIYDVTDYVHYLKNNVDLAAHNTQELIDLKFAFIEGIPPRDVHHRQAIWSDWQSFSYANLDNDVNLSAVSVPLADSSSTFKIKSRMTGHGHYGNTNCCEWDPKDHYIKIDGVDRFIWDIWEETACGDNPNPSQGGTWPYAREGWCPGDMVKEYDHEITPYVTPGTSVSIDYDIEDVPAGDQAQGGGNYVMAMDLISYSAPNFQHDAAIVEVLNPNNYEYYRKWNPSCQNPRVIIQNTGEQPLTECTIRIFVNWLNPIEYTWTGNLEFLEKEIVEIPITDDGFWGDYFGLSEFTAEIANLGAHSDEYLKNNKRTVQFDAPKSVEGKFLVWFNTNNRASENKWRLEDSEGNILFERTSLSNSTSYQDTFDLAPGCYSVILEDSDSDGLGYWYSNQAEGETNGTFRLKKAGGPNIEVFPRDFGNFHRFNFSVGFTLGQDEVEFDGNIGLYPNPNDGSFFVECHGLTDNDATVEVRDMMGRVLMTKSLDVNDGFSSSHFELENIPAGNYFVVVRSNKGVFTKKMVKTK